MQAIGNIKHLTVAHFEDVGVFGHILHMKTLDLKLELRLLLAHARPLYKISIFGQFKHMRTTHSSEAVVSIHF